MLPPPAWLARSPRRLPPALLPPPACLPPVALSMTTPLSRRPRLLPSPRRS
ncbi:hypothetical protein K402DRAFT_467984, partial [Aulographum hederae CBS 113979]